MLQKNAEVTLLEAVKAVRGMHDIFGDEADRWLQVEKRVRSVFADFGYREVRTPILEKMEVFSQTVGEDTDIVEKQMYEVAGSAVLDAKERERLVMRPEGTAAFIRAVIEHNLHRNGPGRFYYYQPMFRHERPQKGRLRQFHQFGAEFINDPSPEADAEIIMLLDHLYKSFGITEYEIRLNSVGDAESRANYKEVLRTYFRPHLDQLCEQCKKRFERSPMRILDCKGESCKAIAAKAPVITDHLNEASSKHYMRVQHRLGQAGVKFMNDPHIVRGLDYYCGTAFEFTSNLLGAQSALGGGGRYDGLSTRFGEAPFPAVGWGLGMERLMMVLEQKQSLPKTDSAPTFFFAPMSPVAFDFLFPLLASMRRQGVRAEMSFEPDKKLKWLMKQADRVGARYAVIVGEDELGRGEVSMKKLGDGTQETIKIDVLPQTLIARAGETTTPNSEVTSSGANS